MNELEINVVSGIECVLGEGLHWDTEHQLLWLVDIVSQQIISMNPQTQEVIKRFLPEPVGWVITVDKTDTLLAGLKSGIGLVQAFNFSAPLTYLDNRFPGHRDIRMNDAKMDRFGRLWCGSMSTLDNPQPVGSLAQYSTQNGSWTIIDTDYVIPNGPAFNADASLALHSDSAKRRTYRYHLNKETGDIEGRSIWRDFTRKDGKPDGMTFDAEGFVWIAHWGIGEVRRYDPEGILNRVVSLPTAKVTNVCFGGPDLETMYVTSAGYYLDENPEKNDQFAGKLFEIIGIGVRGVPPISAKLTDLSVVDSAEKQL